MPRVNFWFSVLVSMVLTLSGMAEEKSPASASEKDAPKTEAPVPKVTYVTTDTTTQGAWKEVYGSDGYVVIGDTQSLPAYAQMTVMTKKANLANCGLYQYIEHTYIPSTTEVRALLNGAGTDRLVAGWFSYYLTLDLNFTDNQMHRIAIYCLDWKKSMAQKIEFLNPETDAVIDTRKIKGFDNGHYLVWDVKGHVHIKVSSMAEARAGVSGIFFQPTPPPTPPAAPVSAPAPAPAPAPAQPAK